MKLDDYIRYFPNHCITEEELIFCRYMEAKGLRFCVDFGYENAANKSLAMLDQSVLGESNQ